MDTRQHGTPEIRPQADPARPWRGAVDTRFRGTALHRKPVQGGEREDGDVQQPPTAGPGEIGRDIVRFLLGTDGTALLTEIAAHLPAVHREELQRAVAALEEAGIVSVDPGYGEPRVRLELPVDEDVFEER